MKNPTPARAGLFLCWFLSVWRWLQRSNRHALGVAILLVCGLGIGVQQTLQLRAQQALGQFRAVELDREIATLQRRLQEKAERGEGVTESGSKDLPTRAQTLASLMEVFNQAQIDPDDFVVSQAVESKRAPGALQQDIHVQLHGPYSKVVSLLHRLQNTSAGVQIIAVTMTRDPQQDGQVRVDVVLRANLAGGPRHDKET